MALVLSHEAARRLYSLALARKKDPSVLLAELIERAHGQDQGDGNERRTKRIARTCGTEKQAEVQQ
ncbi:MAG: hypothetical protein ACUVX9_12400 [Anaerolineae bacterium]